MTKEKDNELKVVIKAKELAVHSFKLTSNSDRYPKKYRVSLCNKIQIKSIEIDELLLEANRINNATNKYLRCETITKAITYCDELLFFIELSMEVVSLAPKSAAYWSKLVSDVKYMAIAWRTKEQK
ncbi:MAG: four helix bundle protein [Clostridia bacterium]|nr:four helix bundle protein [Clostridia bacterium]